MIMLIMIIYMIHDTYHDNDYDHDDHDNNCGIVQRGLNFIADLVFQLMAYYDESCEMVMIMMSFITAAGRVES